MLNFTTYFSTKKEAIQKQFFCKPLILALPKLPKHEIKVIIIKGTFVRRIMIAKKTVTISNFYTKIKLTMYLSITNKKFVITFNN